MDEHVSDERLLAFYKRQLGLPRFRYAAKKLHSQAFCAVRQIQAPGYAPATFIIANDERATVWGVQRCKSPWACPVCSAKRMSKYAADIAVALDAMAKRGKHAFMITFCVPHLKKYTCEEVFKILEATWLRFVHHANGLGKMGKSDVFGKFVRAINCKERIRVGEFTWGKNGWHPHYHCLFFCDADKLQAAGDWQDALRERWLHIAKQMTARVLGNRMGEETAKAEAERLFANISQPDLGAFISRNVDGTVRRALSADYICGWGADKELTGNIRKEATAEGHYTPHQLLKIAYELDSLGNHEEATEYTKLYVEYAMATHRRYRVRVSPALNKIIKAWKQTEQYIAYLKKKDTETRTQEGNWRLVCWFRPEQWLQICNLSLLPAILDRAREQNGRELIEQLLLRHHIDITRNGEHPHAAHVIGKLFNRAA